MLTVQRLRFSTSTPTTQRIQLFDSKFPAVFHYEIVTDHSLCLPHFLLLNAESKSSSRTDEIRHNDCNVKFKNNTSGRARLWGTALKFLCPRLSITSPDHLVSARIKKMAAFSLRLDPAIEVNRHFLENEYSNESFFSVVLNWVTNFPM